MALDFEVAFGFGEGAGARSTLALAWDLALGGPCWGFGGAACDLVEAGPAEPDFGLGLPRQGATPDLSGLDASAEAVDVLAGGAQPDDAEAAELAFGGAALDM